MVLNIISSLKESGSSVLLTGHTGFKGTWMTLLLEQLGIEVFGYSLEGDATSLFQRLNRRGKINERFSDIRDCDALNKFMKQTRPDFVLHMAAQSLVIDSYENPKETFDINVMGTINLLDVVREIESVKVVGVVTTDKVYKNFESGRRFIESDQLEGKDPYSASKVATEAVITAWNTLNSMKNSKTIVALRAGNVIGGGDFAANRLLPDIVRGFQNDEKIEIRNPMSTRPWQHVIDPLLGYLAAMQYSVDEGDIKAFNFGPLEGSLSVDEVMKIASNILKVEFKSNEQQLSQKAESKLLDLDSGLANEKLRWRPTWSQEEAIISTLNWWKGLLVENHDPFALCLADIEKRLAG